jgi:hypothetical protein
MNYVYCRDLLQHMRLHGVTEPEDYISKAMQGKNMQKMTPVKTENRTEEASYCVCVCVFWGGGT